MIEFKEFNKITRFNREVIVTEKIDGTNACIYIEDEDNFLTGSRTRWITPENDNHGFSKWAHENKEELMKLGNGRHFGEWWGSKIQRGYGLPKGENRFSLFDVERWSINEGAKDTLPSCVSVVPIIWQGLFCELDTDSILDNLRNNGSVAAKGFMNPEGIVVLHVASGAKFKRTIERDLEPKSLNK